MATIRRLVVGAALCVAGFAIIFFGLERQSDRVGEVGGQPQAEIAAPPLREGATIVDPEVGNAANRKLKINDAGLAIIKASEGLRLDAYEASGRWFIGYGHSGAEPGSTITEAEADRLLRQDVAGAEDSVRRLVTVPVNVNEFSAMVSLAYNLGSGGFLRSSVLEKINDGDRAGAAEAFRSYVRSGYQVLEHLKQRREKERALFLTPA